MCTTKELIEFLQQFPDDTKVEVLEYYARSWDPSVRWKELDLEQNSGTWYYYDSQGILYLGEE
jgi:hypothetical protein